MGFSKEDIKDVAWKWRCKLASVGQSADKTLSDFESAESTADNAAKPGTDKTANPAKANANPAASPAANASASKEPGFGGAAAVKILYEGKNSTEGFIDWQDFPPRQISKSAARAQDRVAIKVYKIKDKDKPVIAGKFQLKYHRIDIQNPLLVAALEPILKREEVHLPLDVDEPAVFNEPFRPLYFSYDSIVAKSRALTDDDAALKPFFLLLIRVLDDVFHELRAKRKGLLPQGLISFAHAWSYFARDSVLLSHSNNCDLLCKVVDTSYFKKTPNFVVLRIRCKVLRFNGEAFVWEDQELDIMPFNGNRPVTELRHYPLEFHDDAEGLKAKMQARGQMVLDYQGLGYCQYTGIGIYHEEKKSEKHNVDCRILIDVIGYNKHHLAQGVREGMDPESVKNIVAGTGRNSGPSPRIKAFVAVAAAAKNAAESPTTSTRVTKRLTPEEQQHNKDIMLQKPSDLMFMSPLVEGYALKNKEWLLFYVEDIRPMEWNDEAYDHLVYDEQQKDLVLSFVQSHESMAKPGLVHHSDVIIGKGNGLIILLSGPPGTGKTLTAEAVADRTKRPLFYLQAEDLGINAAALGANLKKVFEMATEWNAVILLDEADVFMSKRHPQDIARNELVSIFLRELEYFRGILFLTTNLFDTLDSAFRSRVSLHLLFKSLSRDARLAVWRKFLERLPQQKQPQAALDDAEHHAQPLTDDDVDELASWNLNGREIKTATRMVQTWCDHMGYAMTLDRLENGIKVTSPHATKLSNDDTDLYD